VNEFFPVFSNLSYEFNVPEVTAGTVSSTYMIEITINNIVILISAFLLQMDFHIFE